MKTSQHRRRSWLFGWLLLLAIPVTLAAGDRGMTPSAAPKANVVPGELVVVFKASQTFSHLSVGSQRLAQTSKSLGISKQGLHFAKIKLSAGVSLEQGLEAYRADGAVLAVAPNYLRYPSLTPNETRFGEMWGLHNTGQSVPSPVYSTNNPGTADADIDAPEAWDVMVAAGQPNTAVGSTSVTVAVIDSGVDYTHPDLSGAMWDATGATPSSNFHGYDFANGDTDPYPVNSDHGTHVAGTIAASGNNTIGVTGVAYGVQIMALKVFPDLGGGASDADIIDAINYAVTHGAHIINMSLGGAGPESTPFTTAVANAVNAGVLIVAAASNDGTNNDTTPVWPANYARHSSTRSGVISVAATDQRDQLATFSNTGPNTVSVGAPGVNILSTVTGRTIRQQETGASLPNGTTNCNTDVATCFDNTIFNNGVTDCTGAACRWGLEKNVLFSGLTIGGDISASAGTTYANNVNGTITAQTIDVSADTRVVLRYAAWWDLQCGSGNNDYVDVQVWNGSTWITLQAPNFNINDALANFCASSHTHTGRQASAFPAPVEVSHDITAYINPALQVRFTYVTDGSVNTTVIPYAFQIWDIYIDVLPAAATDYATSYKLSNGTSMASPMTAGVAALVKSYYPAYSVSQLKTAVVNVGDSVSALMGQTVSGRRVNAFNALAKPVLTSLSPAAAVPGAAAFTLTVNGVNFENGAVVRWNGFDRATTFVSATQLTAQITAADVATAGSYSVTVHNPVANTDSEAQTFTVRTSSSGGGGGSCFIATAAYGTPMAEDVRYLRAFRDQHLLDNDAGRWFVKQYYSLSPPVADYIREREGLKSLVRAGLAPLVGLSKWLVDEAAVQKQTADRP